jgi:hypothetical protein
MGMDVIGKSPTSEQGKYFRSGMGEWYSLWTYCEQIASDLIHPGNLGHSNNGWGLNQKDSLALADRLAAALASGETQAYAKRRAEFCKALPLEVCVICGGTGRRAEPPKTGPGALLCNACGGKGTVPSFAAEHLFSVEAVREFEAFLRGCGGFRIC